MTAHDLLRVARVGVAAGWHAAATAGAPAVAHLMPTSWRDDGRKSRPALCGERRARWTGAEHVDRDLRPCDRCLTAAEELPPVGKLVRLAPAAERTEHAHGRITDPGLPSTVTDRMQRRRQFREALPLSEDGQRYVDALMAQLRDRERRAAASPGIAVPDWYAPDPGAGAAPEAVERPAAVVPPAVDVGDVHRPLVYSSGP